LPDKERLVMRRDPHRKSVEIPVYDEVDANEEGYERP
jgi:hypothetical protein